MENRIALIGIILESRDSVDELNHLLSQYGDYVIGRMGIPYREKGVTTVHEIWAGGRCCTTAELEWQPV